MNNVRVQRVSDSAEISRVSLNRRRYLAIAGGIAGSAILTACGSSATDTPKPAATIDQRPVRGDHHGRIVRSHDRHRDDCSHEHTDREHECGNNERHHCGTRTIGGRRRDVAGSSAVTRGRSRLGQRAAGWDRRGRVLKLVIEAVEYGFKTLGSIPAGVTTVQLKNLGTEAHEAGLVRLNDGVTVAQFMDALKQSGGGPPPPIFTYEGGVPQLAASKTATVVLALSEGQYVLVCTVRAPDGQPHAAKGMVLPVQVTAASGTPGRCPWGAGSNRARRRADAAGNAPGGPADVPGDEPGEDPPRPDDRRHPGGQDVGRRAAGAEGPESAAVVPGKRGDGAA